MGWTGSSRKTKLRAEGTNGWAEQKLARHVIARDHGICYVCGLPGADQADHVVPISRGGAHHPANMRAIHKAPCHADKTRAETVAARHPHSRLRPPERHPGLVGESNHRQAEHPSQFRGRDEETATTADGRDEAPLDGVVGRSSTETEVGAGLGDRHDGLFFAGWHGSD